MNTQQTLEHMESIQKDIKALNDVLEYAELLQKAGKMTQECFVQVRAILHGAIDGSQRAFDVFELELELQEKGGT